MKILKSLKFIFYSLFFILVSLSTAYAADPTPIDAKSINLPTSKFDGKDLVDVLSGVIDWFVWLVSALAVIAIVYSGIMYMTAGGDETKAATAKKNLLWAILGIIIVFLSYAIIGIIHNIVSTAP